MDFEFHPADHRHARDTTGWIILNQWHTRSEKVGLVVRW
jgi:hypothetical protein